MSASDASQGIEHNAAARTSHGRTDARALLATCVAAAARGADVVRKGAERRASLVWETKGYNDFVSEIDRASEATIAEVVAGRHPDATLVAEEGSPNLSRSHGLVFVADPLDGTTNFLHGVPHYAVSIAALIDGDVVAGATINAATGELFTATLGGGARRAGQPIRVSDTTEPGRSLIATGLPWSGDEDIAQYMVSLPNVMRSTAASAARAPPRSISPTSPAGDTTRSGSFASIRGTWPPARCSCARRVESSRPLPASPAPSPKRPSSAAIPSCTPGSSTRSAHHEAHRVRPELLRGAPPRSRRRHPRRDRRRPRRLSARRELGRESQPERHHLRRGDRRRRRGGLCWNPGSRTPDRSHQSLRRASAHGRRRRRSLHPARGIDDGGLHRARRQLGERVGRELGIPVFLYERAATRPDRENLADVRRGEFEGLREEIGRTPQRTPDFGPATVHPTAGAVAIGARPFLVAYNVYLGPASNLAVAKEVAKAVRGSSGGLRYVKAMGFEVDGQAQVSMNLVDTERTPLHVAFDCGAHRSRSARRDADVERDRRASFRSAHSSTRPCATCGCATSRSTWCSSRRSAAP
jgi:fructose-1,6-bisphosphatase/inositol monophosphatase family enzyme